MNQVTGWILLDEKKKQSSKISHASVPVKTPNDHQLYKQLCYINTQADYSTLNFQSHRQPQYRKLQSIHF
jgi:hypothetical protein